jgi:CO dehydrogenase maturation factor
MLTEADVAVLDMEAGLEHLGRGTVEHVDLLLIVVEPYYRALEVASRAAALAMELGVPRILLVANRVRTAQDQDAVTHYCRAHNLELIATIPFDEAVVQAEQHDQAPIDYAPGSPAMRAMRTLAATLRARLA